MLFYTVLFVICMMLAAVIVYMKKAIVGGSTRFHKVGRFRSKEKFTAAIDGRAFATMKNSTLTPWGWRTREKPSQTARLIAARPTPTSGAPWGWPGNNSKIRKHQPQTPGKHTRTQAGQVAKQIQSKKPAVGSPYRNGNNEFVGRTYKVTRKTGFRVTSGGRLDKPWGW